MPRGVYKKSLKHRENLRKSRIGKTLSPEHREKIRQAKLGKNNPMYGRHHSDLMKIKNRLAHSGEKAYNWKGDNVGKEALHDWVGVRLLKPNLCQHCNLIPPLDLANMTGVYNRELVNWVWLCRGCHQRYDYRVLKVRRVGKRVK